MSVKILLILLLANGLVLSGFADRGISKKAKPKVTLNIIPATTNSPLSLNLKSGLQYKGSLLSNVSSTGNTITSNTLVTYQKGNTIYILPYKQKIIVPEIKQGYTGLKLVLKTN